jgi:hypothetical protein
VSAPAFYVRELLLVGVLAALAFALLRNPTRVAFCEKMLNSHSAVAVAAALSGGMTWFVWGSLTDVPTIHDEASYLLQAKLFASGHWTAPAAPIPAFFEQFHVFVNPVIASKYPPGHSLLLVPGVWLGLPGLVPMLLVAASGALVFALARRLANPWVGLLTFLLWAFGKTELRFHSSYLSENTTGLCWLVGFWALLEFRERREAKWLSVLAACVAWGAITRPLTMVAYAIPVAVVVLWIVRQHRAWRTMLPAAALGAAVIGVFFVGNAKVTGHWRTMPWNLWSQEYMPWDAPGFGFDSAPPRRTLPPDMQAFTNQFAPYHRAHTLDNLPHEALERLSEIAEGSLGSWRRPDVRTLLAPFAVIGLLLLAWGRSVRGGRLALVCALALIGSYLSYAHPATWTLYYLECSWLLPFAASLGLWATMTFVARRQWPDKQILRRYVPRDDRGLSPAAAMASSAMIAALALYALPRAMSAKDYEDLSHKTLRSWRVFLGAQIPASQRAIVFVRYAPGHVQQSWIANEPDLGRAHLWLVYDRGAENARLAALAPDRATYLFDESTRSLTALAPTLAGR